MSRVSGESDVMGLETLHRGSLEGAVKKPPKHSSLEEMKPQLHIVHPSGTTTKS